MSDSKVTLGIDYPRLLWGAMHNLKCKRGQRNVQRWVLVMECFGIGSTSAIALCHQFALDPYEVIK